MCQQRDAPAGIINTCNGFYCHGFQPNKRDTPAMWTENWPGWFQSWGGAFPARPVQDVAYAVARFFAYGGSLQNYYMYHGGTNFARTVGGPNIVTSYDYDVALDEYGLPHEPKYTHSAHLHAHLHACERALLERPVPQPQPLGKNTEAHVYGVVGEAPCCAFLSNMGMADENVTFAGRRYLIPAWSVSLLRDDCTREVFNTARVVAPTTHRRMRPAEPRTPATRTAPDDHRAKRPRPQRPQSALPGGSPRSGLTFDWYPDTVGLRGDHVVQADHPLEQLNVTHDTTDYLWYVRNFSHTGGQASLRIQLVSDVVHVFVNGAHRTTTRGGREVTVPIETRAGINTLQLMTSTLGLINYGLFMERYVAGINGHIYLDDQSITSGSWYHQAGTKGEALRVFAPDGARNVSWIPGRMLNRPMTWYRAYFGTPAGSLPLAVDLSTMNKGFVFVNGHNLGRYWVSQIAPMGDCDTCDYRGPHTQTRCQQGCGRPSQRWYHLPRDWLHDDGTPNLLVLFEEIGSDPDGVSLVTRETDVVCGSVGENWPADDLAVQLLCGDGQRIEHVEFASFGQPLGDCRQYSVGSCHAANSSDIVAAACVGKPACAVPVTIALFGDPCPNQTKRLSVQVQCGSGQLAA